MDRRDFMKTLVAAGAVTAGGGLGAGQSWSAGTSLVELARTDLKPAVPIEEHIFATGSKGMVSSSHPLATIAAVEALKKGGSAADGYLTAAFCHVDQEFGGTQIEGSFPEEILHGVEKRGMDLTRTSPWYVYMGSLQGVKLDRGTGIISGVADPRRLGMTKGI
jgi:gamma-glutamyltranspeptidase